MIHLHALPIPPRLCAIAGTGREEKASMMAESLCRDIVKIDDSPFPDLRARVARQALRRRRTQKSA